jgi:hypothetical protein
MTNPKVRNFFRYAIIVILYPVVFVVAFGLFLIDNDTFFETHRQVLDVLICSLVR